MTYESAVTIAAAILVPAGLYLAHKFWQDKSAEREAQLRWAIALAYDATNEISKMTSNTLDDKAAYALGVLNEALKAKGADPASVDEEKQARLTFKALHGREKVAAEMVAATPR